MARIEVLPFPLNSQHSSICFGLNEWLTIQQVQDISGGCGSMYALDITSPKFKGLSVIKQHKLVNSVLKEEIGRWHGVQLKTRAA